MHCFAVASLLYQPPPPHHVSTGGGFTPRPTSRSRCGSCAVHAMLASTVHRNGVRLVRSSSLRQYCAIFLLPVLSPIRPIRCPGAASTTALGYSDPSISLRRCGRRKYVKLPWCLATSATQLIFRVKGWFRHPIVNPVPDPPSCGRNLAQVVTLKLHARFLF